MAIQPERRVKLKQYCTEEYSSNYKDIALSLGVLYCERGWSVPWLGRKGPQEALWPGYIDVWQLTAI